MKSITFKQLDEEKLQEVRSIYEWYIFHSTATFHTEPVSIEELKEFIFVNHPLYPSYLIMGDIGPMGYCFLTYHKKRQAYNRTAELTIYLKPEYCGKGIGRIALEKLEQDARDRNLKNLIGVISGDNEGSIALFSKAGYTKCAHFKNVGEKFNKVIDVVAFQKEMMT